MRVRPPASPPQYGVQGVSAKGVERDCDQHTMKRIVRNVAKPTAASTATSPQDHRADLPAAPAPSQKLRQIHFMRTELDPTDNVNGLLRISPSK